MITTRTALATAGSTLVLLGGSGAAFGSTQHLAHRGALRHSVRTLRASTPASPGDKACPNMTPGSSSSTA